MNEVRREIGTGLGIAAALAAAVFVLSPTGATAVVMDSENKITEVLDDGTTVVMYGEYKRGQKSRNYHYLPTNLRVSKRPDGTPEFLFLKFTTEAREDQGGVSGALMHFLMEWGLTPAQQEEVESRLKTKHRGAKIMGAIEMLPGANDTAGTFRVISGVLGDEKMAPSVVTSGKAPLVPGGKTAVAARLDKNGAQLLAATFEKARSITDVSLALDFTYQMVVPGATGTITIHWSKIEEHKEKIVAEYKKKKTGTEVKGGCVIIFCAFSAKPTYSHSYNETREQYDFLSENKYVDVKFDEFIADNEKVGKIRDAFFQYFLNAVSEMDKAAQSAPPPDPAQKEKMPDIKHGNQYKYRKEVIEKSVKRGSQTMRLSYNTSLKFEHQLVGNLATWYDHVRDNPKCVASVNLNDPFFQHRDVLMILDLDAKEMFDQAVNYVTVDIRKRRSAGNDFEDHVTIDKKFIEENGIRASVTYSRGEDTDPDAYEYRTQWSIKGGNVYPEDPPWQQGRWEGVTLAPPVVPRLIEVEADLAAMEASDISRVTVQIRYYQFGREEEENIHISPAGGEGLVSKAIFTDRDAKGYAYRLVVNHKTQGKLALPWSAQVGDNYVFAQIPENLLEEPTVLETAKAAAADMAKEATVNVLSRFKNLVAEGGE
jgi:hypothetical protein